MSAILKMIIDIDDSVSVKALHALIDFISAREHANNPRVFFHKEGVTVIVYGKEENVVELFECLEPFDRTIRDMVVRPKVVQGSYLEDPEARL